MKSALLGLCCVALISLASCAHKAGHHEHSCKCGSAKAEQSCAGGECSLEKKCESCEPGEK